jgi:hypothetical protein
MSQAGRGIIMRTFALAAALLLAACSGSTTSSATASTASPGSNPTPSLTAPVKTAASSPAPSAACIDRGTLADNGEVVVTVLQGLVADLKVPNVVRAKADAASAAAGLRSLADLVSPVQPEAAQDFLTAASDVDSAVPQFPGGQSLVDMAQTSFSTGLSLAHAAVCPD